MYLLIMPSALCASKIKSLRMVLHSPAAPTSVTILLRIIHGVHCRTSKWYCNLPKLHGGANQLVELRYFHTTFIFLLMRLTSDPTSIKQPCYLYMVANGTFIGLPNHVIFTRVFELELVLLKPLYEIIITCSVNIFTSQNLQPKYYFVMRKSTFEKGLNPYSTWNRRKEQSWSIYGQTNTRKTDYSNPNVPVCSFIKKEIFFCSSSRKNIN